MRKLFARFTFLFAMVTLVAWGVLLSARPAMATTSNPPDKTANLVVGNAVTECKQIGFDNGFKVEGKAPNGIYTVSNVGTITISNSDGKVFDWISTFGIEAVLVKAGQGFNIYYYSPPSFGDERLYAFQSRDISHVTFCWGENNVPPQPLEVEKTADASYTRTITWQLTKTVDTPSVSGNRGQVASPSPTTWTVTATKSTNLGGYTVTGEIKVTNPNGFPVGFSLTDTLNDAAQTQADIDCPSYTVGANSSVTCTYTASPSGKTATQNNVEVTSDNPNVNGDTASAPLNWEEIVVGDESVTLADNRFSYSEVISGDKTKTFQESFTCPSDVSLYVNDTYTFDVINTATLTGPNTDISRNAKVTVTCKLVWVNETATGRGLPWSRVTGAPANWFMYTAWSALQNEQTVDLIAGQYYDAGDIKATRNGTTSITITLHNGFRFANVSNNVKIHPMSAPKSYVQPGAYSVKRTASGNSITITGLSNTDFYAIHVDVQRLLP